MIRKTKRILIAVEDDHGVVSIYELSDAVVSMDYDIERGQWWGDTDFGWRGNDFVRHIRWTAEADHMLMRQWQPGDPVFDHPEIEPVRPEIER